LAVDLQPDWVSMSVAPRSRPRAPVADRKAREFLRKADPVLGGVIDAHPGFRPRAWMDDLPPRDAFGTLTFQVVGQQLSVAATRTIVGRIEERFGGRLPTPAEALAADPQVLRTAGLSARKGATIRALAERFADGRLSDEGLAAMTDDEVEAVLTEVPGIGPWSAHGFLLVALDRPDVYLTGDIALWRDSTRLRIRPRPDRGRARRALRPLAPVPEPRGELSLRVGVRRRMISS
jgi:DNA-3-methyladenine glycosylase II